MGILWYYSGAKEILGVVFKRPEDIIWCATSKYPRVFSSMNGVKAAPGRRGALDQTV